MYFCLNPHIDIVKGKNNYLVVDTKSCSFYSIDKKFYCILQRCKSGEQIENISNDTEFLLHKLSQLSSLGIGQIESHFKHQQTATFKKNILNMVWLNVTNKCNYRCIHCYENASQEKTDESMTLDDYDKLLQRSSSRRVMKPKEGYMQKLAAVKMEIGQALFERDNKLARQELQEALDMYKILGEGKNSEKIQKLLSK